MLWPVTHATGGGVNHDLLADEPDFNKKNFARVLTGIGLCGSAAAFDCEAELVVGGVKMGKFRNLATGAPTKDHILRTAIPIPPNSLVQMLVVIDSTTNPFNFIFETVP